MSPIMMSLNTQSWCVMLRSLITSCGMLSRSGYSFIFFSACFIFKFALAKLICDTAGVLGFWGFGACAVFELFAGKACGVFEPVGVASDLLLLFFTSVIFNY